MTYILYTLVVDRLKVVREYLNTVVNIIFFSWTDIQYT